VSDRRRRCGPAARAAGRKHDTHKEQDARVAHDCASNRDALLLAAAEADAALADERLVAVGQISNKAVRVCEARRRHDAAHHGQRRRGRRERRRSLRLLLLLLVQLRLAHAARVRVRVRVRAALAPRGGAVPRREHLLRARGRSARGAHGSALAVLADALAHGAEPADAAQLRGLIL
jgi:hypothetical protein